MTTNRSFNYTDVARLCEIARLHEVHNVNPGEEIEENLGVYLALYDKWGNFEDIKNEEEEGYVVAYADRVLFETFKAKR